MGMALLTSFFVSVMRIRRLSRQTFSHFNCSSSDCLIAVPRARYHVDNVPNRLLVTYAGKGTEWLPEDASVRGAYARGEPNEKIIKDHSAKQFIEQWDVAIFRGGASGLLHRTPDPALQANSILMRLDRDVHN